jgi:hypothetical protein
VAFFTEDEHGSLTIHSMILHVVGTEKFEAQSARDVEHETFFLSRIFDLDSVPVYSFDEESSTKKAIEEMAQDLVSFEQGAQDLSREFSKMHIGATKEGALFIFELRSEGTTDRVYCLIKYDYREVIEQKLENGENLLRKIVTAFVGDKKAIQKAAFIRTVDGEAQLEVCTKDRAKTAPDIGEYFEKFLNVKRTLTDKQLTQRVRDTVRVTLVDLEVLLAESVSRAFSHTMDTLRDRALIDEEAIIEAIRACLKNDASEDDHDQVSKVTLRKLRANRLTGVAFRPDKEVLRKSNMHRLKTVENITLIYPDRLGNNGVVRAKQADGSEVITIRTNQITEDTIVPDHTR